MIIRKASDGNYYVCRRRGKNLLFVNWFWIKFISAYSGQLNIGRINFPKEFVGKKIRLKVELIENEKIRRDK